MGEYNIPPVYNGSQGYQRKVTFEEAIKRGFDNYANFNGRASRSEYWYWFLFTFLVSMAASVIDAIIGTEVITGLAALALLLPGLAISWRRLHDIGRAGGWYFICFIPIIGSIILLIWDIKESEMCDNRFGPIPNWVN